MTDDQLTRRMSHTFRPATPEDAPAVEALVHEAYQLYIPRLGVKPGPMEADYREVLQQRDVEVAESDGAMVGLIVMHDTDDDFVIENVRSVRGTRATAWEGSSSIWPRRERWTPDTTSSGCTPTS